MSRLTVTREDIGDIDNLQIEKELAGQYGNGVHKKLTVICTSEGFVFDVSIHRVSVLLTTSLDMAIESFTITVD